MVLTITKTVLHFVSAHGSAVWVWGIAGSLTIEVFKPLAAYAGEKFLHFMKRSLRKQSKPCGSAMTVGQMYGMRWNGKRWTR